MRDLKIYNYCTHSVNSNENIKVALEILGRHCKAEKRIFFFTPPTEIGAISSLDISQTREFAKKPFSHAGCVLLPPHKHIFEAHKVILYIKFLTVHVQYVGSCGSF